MKLENKDIEIIKDIISNAHDEFKQEIMYHIDQRNRKQLWSTKDVMNEFQICKKTVSNWADKGILNPLYVGHRVYYKIEDIERVKNN